MKRPRLKLIFIIGLGSVILLILASFLIIGRNKDEIVHYHAGFAVFTNNKQADFSDFKYMIIKPCNLDKDEEKESDEDDQIEKAHLHDQIGDVVHIERKNAKWSDLFTNLKYDINYQEVVAYLNSKKTTDFENLIIQPYDSLVILIGKNDSKKALAKAVKKSHIEETEKRSENCGS